MSTVSRYLMLAGRSDESIRIGREAAAMAEFFGLEAVRANALDNIGAARCHSGDPAGIDDLENSIVIAEISSVAWQRLPGTAQPRVGAVVARGARSNRNHP